MVTATYTQNLIHDLYRHLCFSFAVAFNPATVSSLAYFRSLSVVLAMSSGCCSSPIHFHFHRAVHVL